MVDGGLAWFESYRKLVVTHQIAFALIEGLDRVVQLLDRNRHSAPNGRDGLSARHCPRGTFKICSADKRRVKGKESGRPERAVGSGSRGSRVGRQEYGGRMFCLVGHAGGALWLQGASLQLEIELRKTTRGETIGWGWMAAAWEESRRSSEEKKRGGERAREKEREEGEKCKPLAVRSLPMLPHS